jgi:signal transduction histidine kinase
MLLRKLILISVLLSLALAAVSLWGIERVRARDRVLAIERMAVSQTTDLIRARCEANPKWFLAGPRESAPSAEIMAHPDADVLAPRPDSKPRPVEFFAYDLEYVGQSTAAPRLPVEMRSALRRGEPYITIPFRTEEGVGVQTAMRTNWEGPCYALLFRMHPPPGQLMERARIFGFLFVGIFAVLMVPIVPLNSRVHGVAKAMRDSARTDYREGAAIKGNDELSSLGFAFNEATVDIRRLQTDVRDREADFRRFVGYVGSEVDEPLRASIAQGDAAQSAQTALHLGNLLIGARFRDIGDRAKSPVDVAKVAQQAAWELAQAFKGKGVRLDTGKMDTGIVIQGEPSFLLQAVRNLLSYSLQRVSSDGVVKIEVLKTGGGSWTMGVTDNGVPPSDIELRALNAVRRFRGDEGRGAELRGDIGLPLAVVHEVCHQFGLTLKFARAAGGGLEVTLSGVQQGVASAAP